MAPSYSLAARGCSRSSTHGVAFFSGSIAGLEVGSPVTFRGVRIGEVERVTLHVSPDRSAWIAVYLEFLPDQVAMEGGRHLRPDTDLDQLVRSGLRAQLNLQSVVTGQLRVDLDFNPGSPEALVPVDTGEVTQIPTLPSDMERLRATISDVPFEELAQTALRTLEIIERLGQRLDRELDPLLDETHTSLQGAARTFDTVERAIGQLQADASLTLEELRRLAVEARRQLEGRGAEMTEVLASADRAGRQAEALLASANSLMEPRSRFRDDLEATSRDLAASANALRSFARELERDPSILLKGRSER